MSSVIPTTNSPDDFPELRTCNSVRASIVRELLRDRNTLDRKLDALACPPTARAHLIEWLDDLVRDLPNPGGLAETLLKRKPNPAGFETTWETLESSHGVIGRMPKPARGYLDAIAEHDNAEQLSLFYWARLHHPLRDQLDLLRYSVTDLVLSDPLTRRVHQALRDQDAGIGMAPAGEVGEDQNSERARAEIPAGLQWAEDDEKRALGNLTRTADPIARLLSDVQVQPIHSDATASPLAHRQAQERRLATRTYALRYMQEHLSLPVGRHAVSSHGQPGDDFWVDFGER